MNATVEQIYLYKRDRRGVDRLVDDLAAYTQVTNARRRRMETLNHMLAAALKEVVRRLKTQSPQLADSEVVRHAERLLQGV